MQLKAPFFLSVTAGLFIGIGGCVFLSCESKVVGAVLFAVALLSICYLGLFLFTGKIGYIAVQHDRQSVAAVIVTLIGNFIGTLIAGLAAGVYKPALMETAQTLCSGKLLLEPSQALIAGIFCGVMMYTAVELFKTGKNTAGIFFCVPVFILSGFEHSIADMFYFFTARMFTTDVFAFLAIVVVGNTIGGMLVPFMKQLAGD